MFAYYNDGMSFRAVSDDYTAQPGEVLFADYATDEELIIAFPGYADEQKMQRITEINLSYSAQRAAIIDGITNALAIGNDPASGRERLTALDAEWKASILAANK